MSNRDLEFIEEESSSIQKATDESLIQGKTNFDYAKILADMKKELENIPTKYPEAADDNDISSQKYSQEPSESLELNMVKTAEVHNNKEETNNIAYSDDSKKEISEDNEPYDEDFEQSEDKAQSSNQQATERNESGQSYSRETPNPQKTNLQATVKREKSSPTKKNTSQEDDYENDDFEEEIIDDDISEIKRDKSISSKRSTPPPVTAAQKDNKKDVKKDDKKAPISKPATQNSKPPQPAQSNSAKNFKIKNTPATSVVNKDAKKEPVRPSSSKEPIKQPVQPPTKDSKTITKPPVKRPATAKAILNKTTALANIKNTSKEPSAKAFANTIAKDKVDDKVEEDLFVEEEEMVADQNANPTAVKKMQERPKTVEAKSREQVSNNDDEEVQEEFIKEEDQQGTENKAAKNKFKPQKKVEHKDIMKQIFDSFKKKEEVNQKKDEKIFATEEADKRVKAAETKGKNKAEDQENKWVGNGLGLSTNVADATKKGKTTTSAAGGNPSTQAFAQNFLASLENKFKKVPKLGQTAPAQEEETKEEDKKKRAQSAKKGGSQTSLEKTWKYNVGSGVNSEYEKTQKLKEKEYNKKFTELFKKEKNKAKDQKQENLTKIKQIMNRERENRKAIEEKFVKNMRTGKNDNKEARDPLVLQVQNVYLEEEERNKREKQKEEINQLKLKLKLLKQQNQGLQKDLVDLQHKDSDAGRALDSLASKKAVIMIGKNEFTSLNSHLIPKDKPKKTARDGQGTDRSNILEDENNTVTLDKLSPIEVIINKFADQELELEEIYQLLDKNGDGILTIKEIKEGLDKLNLDLDETEIQQIVSVVDANTDGTITCDEFVSSLRESLAVRKDYKSIMGDLDKITNPIVLEERILDMETRKKLIEEDTKKVTDELKVHEYGYKKLLKRLQEFEGMAGPKKETKADLDHIRNIIIRLKVEIQDAEDMKSRVELMQDERMKDITENIHILEEKIERTIRKIQEEKRKAKDIAQEQQKEELRKIFMMKAFGEIEREMETFDSGLDKNVQKMIEEKQRLQAKREEEENMNALDGHIQNGAAIKIQKIYRGSVTRRKAQNVSTTMLKAKMVILRRWKAYKKRVKTTAFASKLKGLLRRIMGSALEKIKEHSEEKAEQQQEQARVNKEKSKATAGGDNKTPGRDDDEMSQLSGVGENGVPLYTVLYLQDLARKKLGKETPEDKLMYRKTNKKVQKCGVCRKEPIERVCKECEIAVFCNKCFATTHKSRKNHPFIEVKAKSNDEKTINLIESKDPEMAAELNYLQDKYQNEFKNLIAHMRDWDVENAGWFDIRGFRETLKRKVKDDTELDFLVKVAKTYCKSDSNDLHIDYVLFANLVCS